MKTLKTLLAALLISATAFAQNVGINTDGAAPDASAMLDVKSTTKGFLTPRMTASERLAIESPATGLTVYQTDGVSGFYYYNGLAWTLIGNASGATQWTTSGSNIYYSSGKVGIGTASPSAPFHLYNDFGGNTSTQIMQITDNVNALYIFPRLSASAYGAGVQAADMGIFSAPVPLNIGLAGGESVRIGSNITMGLNSGKVGIGTTSPAYKLDVSGGINATAITINGIPVATSTDTYWCTAGSGKIQYSGGNVGIGTTMPAFSLDVVGDVNLTGTVRVNGTPMSGSGTVTSVAASGGTTGLSFTGSPVTTSGTITLGGTLAVTNGGTGATTAPTKGGVIYASSTSTMASTVSGTDGQALVSNGTDAPSWQNMVPPGSIQLFAGSSAPSGFLLCYGQAISRTTYATLFAVIGNTYGDGDGSTTFNLPNIKGRVPVMRSSTDADFSTLGNTGGEKTHTLTTAEMPAHTHPFVGGSHTHSITDPGHKHYIYAAEGGDGNYIDTDADNSATTIHNSLASCANATTGITINSATVSGTNTSNGGGDAHNNLQPYIVLNYMIKY